MFESPKLGPKAVVSSENSIHDHALDFAATLDEMPHAIDWSDRLVESSAEYDFVIQMKRGYSVGFKKQPDPVFASRLHGLYTVTFMADEASDSSTYSVSGGLGSKAARMYLEVSHYAGRKEVA